MSRVPSNPYFTTASGIHVDLVAPRREDVNFGDVAHHLANKPRYGGACTPAGYSVGEHSLKGSQVCTPVTRPYFLLHDGAEYVSGDDVTPKKKALPLVMADVLGGLFPLADIAKMQEAMRDAFNSFEERHARVIHLAAGLEWPVPPLIAEEVKFVDRVMLVTEWQHYMPGDVPPEYRRLGKHEIRPLQGLLSPEPWPFDRARDEFLAACRKWLPVFQGGK